MNERVINEREFPRVPIPPRKRLKRRYGCGVTILILLFNSYHLLAQPQLEWQNRFDYLGGIDFPLQMKLDANGNIFIAGISNLDTFYNDVLTMKINADGITEWYNLIRNDYEDMIEGLEVDTEGNCYLGGDLGNIFLEKSGFMLRYDDEGGLSWIDTTSGVNAICIDSANNIYNLCSNSNLTLIKYNMEGDELLFFTNDTITSFNTPWLYLLKVDDEGNIYVGGQFTSNGSNARIHIKKFSPSGELLWDVKYDPTTDWDRPRFMQVDNLGNIYLVGYTGTYEGSIIVKLDSEGEIAWDDIIFAQYSFPFDLVFDSYGNPVICMKIYEVNKGYDYMIRKYDQEGNVIWTDYLDSAGVGTLDDIAHLTADDFGNIYFAGSLYPVAPYLNSFLMIKYDANGNRVWTYHADSLLNTSSDYPADIALDKYNNIIVTLRSFDPFTSFDLLTLKFSDPTGVHEVQLPDHSLKVIPNPFHADAVVTTSNSTLLNQASTITINDMYGRTMKSASYYNNYQLDRTGIPSGVYLVKVVTASGVSAVTKIIIL